MCVCVSNYVCILKDSQKNLGNAYIMIWRRTLPLCWNISLTVCWKWYCLLPSVIISLLGKQSVKLVTRVITQRSVNKMIPRRQYFSQSIKWRPIMKYSTHLIMWNLEDSTLYSTKWHPEDTVNQVTCRMQYSSHFIKEHPEKKFPTLRQVTHRRQYSLSWMK
jgi:hypothetical protein